MKTQHGYLYPTIAAMTHQMNSRYFESREACPICECDHPEILYSCDMGAAPVRDLIESHYRHQGQIDWRQLEGTDYVLCDCPECGLLYQKHIPNGDLLNTLYNKMISAPQLAELEKSRLTVDDFEEVAGELGVLFRAVGKHPTEITFLDYGMGYGRWARVAVAMGAKVFATEISPEKIETARKLGVQVISDESLSEMRFDIIHAEQVFEHLTHPRRDFERLAGALAPGGIIKLAVPPPGRIRKLLKSHGMIDRSPHERNFNPACREDRSRFEDYVSVFPLEHLNAYSPATIAYMAERSNMQLVGRSRKQSVSINPTGVSQLARSFARLLQVGLRPILRRNSGYYLLCNKQK